MKKEISLIYVFLLLLLFAIGQSRRVIRATSGEETTGSYIVVLTPDTNHTRFETIVNKVKNESVDHNITEKVEGPFAKIIAAKISEETAHRISQIEGVDFVEEETYATASTISWGIDRINQIDSNLDGYSNSFGDGQGIDIYLLDSGINYDHCEFGTRAHYPGYDPLDIIEGTNLKGRDCSGHGTHVASVAIGASVGVANKATVYSVRVLNCTNRAPWSVIIDGLNYAAKQSLNKQHRSLILMPLQGPVSIALNRSLNAVLDRNIPIIVPAGNNKYDNACNYSPANHPGVITVGSSNKGDGLLNETNIGGCVDVFAPGEMIIGANYSCTSCTCTSVRSGTSLSAGLVSGVIALYLQFNSTLSPNQIKQKIIRNCIKNVLEFPPHLAIVTPNCLLHINSTSEFLAQNKVVVETVTESTNPLPNSECCEILKQFKNIDKVLGNIVEKGIDEITHALQDKMMSSNRTTVTKNVMTTTHKTHRVMPLHYTPGSVVESCHDLSHYSNLKSGYYPLFTNDKDETMVYCELEKEIKGNKGFMRIAYVNMSQPNEECPQGLSLRTYNGLRTCQRTQLDGGCSSVYFNAHNIEYTKVCGRIHGYQWASPNAFYATSRNHDITINDPYVDGVVLTHTVQNKREHVWTFAAAIDEIGRSTPFACQCTNIYNDVPVAIPSFVGNDYFCETGVHDETYNDYTLYTGDRLWDGKGCGEVNTCCERGEWFCKDVPKTNSNIELRLCGNEPRTNEDTPLELIELYVQ